MLMSGGFLKGVGIVVVVDGHVAHWLAQSFPKLNRAVVLGEGGREAVMIAAKVPFSVPFQWRKRDAVQYLVPYILEN